MEVEGNGTQAVAEQEQPQGEGQGQVNEDAQVEPQQGLLNGTGADEAFKQAIKERDARIQELEAQVAEAERSTETAEQLRSEIENLKRQAADERVEYELTLAGARNVKAAKALLEDHGGDVSALAAAEPWLFQATQKASGTTGLKPTGAADENERTIEHWRRIAGLD